MNPIGRVRFRHDYLLVRERVWRAHAPHDAELAQYDILNLPSAIEVLTEIASCDERLLDALERELTPYHGRLGDTRAQLATLIPTLGVQLGSLDQPPQFARLYVCRRKMQPQAPLALPDPWQRVREQLERAKQAEPGHVTIELVDQQGEPVPNVAVEVLLADATIQGGRSNAQGLLHLAPVPRGRCHIRLAEFDGDGWYPEAGAPAESVELRSRSLHVVRRGDVLARIARKYGINSYWKLWNAPENEPLRARRKSPHILRPGDEVVIPQRDVHQISRETDCTHRIVLRAVQLKLRVRFQDLAGNPIPDLPYTYSYVARSLEVEKPGSAPTSAEGHLAETLLLDTERLTIALTAPHLQCSVQIAQLFPACDEDTKAPVWPGLHARLTALGYRAGAANDEPTPALVAALRDFQALHLGHEAPNGEPDRQTIQALEEAMLV